MMKIMEFIEMFIEIAILTVVLVVLVIVGTKMIEREKNYKVACSVERTMETLSGTDFTVVDNGDGTFTVE